MKIPNFIIFNDVHLTPGNEEDVIISVKHLIAHANSIGVDQVVFAGDLFESRAFQRQSVLEAFDTILGLFHKAGITLHLFPGNHDKTDYKSSYSFLQGYRFHPCVKFYDKPSQILINELQVTLIPFFDDELLIPMLNETEGSDILISHFEMAGSSHLGKVSEKVTISRKMLRKWEKVYLGHFHNTHEITDDIVHLPSFRQADFGEDSNKGFSVIYDDGSYEIIQGRFKVFNKISIDVDTMTLEKIKQLIKQHSHKLDAVVRFELTGEELKLKAFDKSIFNDTGIDVKIKYSKKFDFEESIKPVLIQKYGKEQVSDSFKAFCKEKDLNYKEGLVFLDEFLKQK